MESKLQETNCLAVGRMDWINTLNFDRITAVGFRKQLLLAQKYNKPVVLHCVASFDELIIKEKNEYFSSMMVHGFSKKMFRLLITGQWILYFLWEIFASIRIRSCFKSVSDDQFFS
jgi:TatD DNase family protein